MSINARLPCKVFYTDEDFNRNVYVIQQCLFLYFIFCLALKDGLVRFYYYYYYYYYGVIGLK